MPRDDACAGRLESRLGNGTDLMRQGVRGCMDRTHELAVEVRGQADEFTVLLEEFRKSRFFHHTMKTVGGLRG